MKKPSELEVGDIVATANGLEVVLRMDIISSEKVLLTLETLGLLKSWAYRLRCFLESVWLSFKGSYRACGRDWDRCWEKEDG